jgi:ATP-dependent Clp protease adaptor protein ClpS
MTNPSTATIEKEAVIDSIKEPGLYKVVFCNDNLTPMDFVVQVLQDVFRHSKTKAEAIMLEIHNKGEGVAGIFVYEIAEQKGVETTVAAREQGYPLAIKVEPV